jgi:hypothetical protein
MRERNLLTIRVLTLGAILLAIVAGLSIYQTNSLKLTKHTPSPTPVQKTASDSAKITGPGGCVGIDQCLDYCDKNPLECAKKAQN